MLNIVKYNYIRVKMGRRKLNWNNFMSKRTLVSFSTVSHYLSAVALNLLFINILLAE